MRMEIPPAVDRIIRRLEESGYEAYAVGGCVRDTLLGRKPEDWDITTSAKPEEVKKVFSRTIDTGIQHGTVTVMDNRVGYEVTTYRIDGEYEDGRHPKSVAYTASLTEDLKRRDFTINAMAYSPNSGMVDKFDGESDLKRKVIRCVGKAEERFTEDALRILRAIRFSAQLGFHIEPSTYEAIQTIAPNMAKVSKERIQTELTKLLLSDNPEKIALVFERGIGPYISDSFSRIPMALESRELLPFYGESLTEKQWFPLKETWKNGFGEDSPLRSCMLSCKKYLRWAAFLRFSGEEEAKKVLRELKLDNDTIGKVFLLVHWCYEKICPDKATVRKAMACMDRELFYDLMDLREFAVRTDYREQPEREKCLLEEVKAVKSLGEEILAAGDCLSMKELAVTGRDLIQEGMKPGKEIGAVLSRLLEDVLEHPEHNTREYLLDIIKK